VTADASAIEAGIAALRDVGALFHDRGWSLGTSSNYSIVLGRDPLRLLLTASGKDKRRLKTTDFVVVDGSGRPVGPTTEKPSAETALHTMLAGCLPGVGSVLHTHSVWGTLLSDLHAGTSGLWIEGYEMLKGLSGVSTHEHRECIAVFPNNQDVPALAETVRQQLETPDTRVRHGFLIRRHGLYTWGRDLDEARRHVEILEFLFEVLGRRLSLPAMAHLPSKE
jgi:methylthioribulose-1-phosphate dehydratase